MVAQHGGGSRDGQSSTLRYPLGAGHRRALAIVARIRAAERMLRLPKPRYVNRPRPGCHLPKQGERGTVTVLRGGVTKIFNKQAL